MKILAVGAHLDDIELSCGGTLAKAVARGDEVMMLVLTHSAYKNFDGETLRTKDQAATEGADAAHRLGVKNLKVLGFETKEVHYDGAAVEAIDKELTAFQPDMIFTHWIFDTHQDHRNTGLATISAARKFSNIYMYEPFPPSGRSYFPFRAQVYSDISDTIDTKISAMKKHVSQYEKYGEDWVEAIKGRARMRGFESGSTYAETFELVRADIDLTHI